MREGDGAGCSHFFGLNKANRELRRLDLDILARSKRSVSHPHCLCSKATTLIIHKTLKHTKLKRCKKKKNPFNLVPYL